MKKGFIYWLFSAAKKPLYINDAGIMQEGDPVTLLRADGKPAHLVKSPDGWKDVLVKWARNIKYFGVFRDFTTNMNFKGDGAKILKTIKWTIGSEAIAPLGISKLNKTIWPDKYETWYTGEPDFSKFRQKKTNVSIPVIEGGLSKLLKAYENTTYEIPVDNDPQAVHVVMDGFPFTNKVLFTIIEDSHIFQAGAGSFWNINIALVSTDGSTQGVLVQESIEIDPSDPAAWIIYSEDKSISVTFAGNFKLTCLHSAKINIRLRRFSLDTSRNTMYDLFFTDAAGGQQIDINFSQVIDLKPREKVQFIADVFDSSIGEFVFHQSEITLTYDVTFRDTIIKALPSLRLFQKLVEKITDGKYTGASSFLAALTDYVITSGSAIRNHEGASATVHGSLIKTSLSDFFKSFQRFGIGLSIENDVMIIEKLEYFFKEDVALELGIVDDVEYYDAEDLKFNTIKSGYQNQTYDAVNGRDEVNVTQQWTTSITRDVKELDLISPYRADPTGIELTRLNLYGKDTTDNTADNDTFFLNVKKGTNYTYFSGIVTFEGSNINIPSPFLNIINGAIITITGSLNAGNFTVTNTSYLIVGYTTLSIAEPITAGTENVEITIFSSFYYQLNRPVFDSITGVLHPAGIFNVLLSPKRSLLNNGMWIHSMLDYQDMNFITFRTGEKNSDLSTTLDGVTITEKENIQVATLPAKKVLPYYMKFTTSVPLNFPALMRTNKYSKISFIDQGIKMYGYIWGDCGIKPATNDVQSWILLSTADNDMTKLINTI